MPGRLLIVDDEKAMRLALKSLLAKEGYEVETAESGEQALRAIEAGSFHMGITDLSMKEVGGTGVLQHTRRIDPGTAVVMITPHGAAEITVAAPERGAAGSTAKALGPHAPHLL